MSSICDRTIALASRVAAAELDAGELDYHDADYEIIIGVRAIKPCWS